MRIPQKKQKQSPDHRGPSRKALLSSLLSNISLIPEITSFHDKPHSATRDVQDLHLTLRNGTTVKGYDHVRFDLCFFLELVVESELDYYWVCADRSSLRRDSVAPTLSWPITTTGKGILFIHLYPFLHQHIKEH